MATMSVAGVTLLWLCQVLVLSFGDTNTGPVLEGHPFKLTCSGNTSDTLKSVDWWMDEAGKESKLASCHIRSATQCDVFISSFTASVEGHTLSLKAQKVTPNIRNSTISCIVLGEKQTRDTFNISNYVHQPDSPECTVQKWSGIEVKITCTTTKVYPNFLCDFTEIDENKKIRRQIISGVRGSLTPFSSESYYSASCSAKAKVNKTGNYSYEVHMYPSLEANATNTGTVKKKTTKLTFNGEPDVHLLAPPTISVCSNRDTSVSFSCVASWFPPPYTDIKWYRNGQHIDLEGLKKNEKLPNGPGGYFSFVSYYNFTANKSQNEETVKCEAFWGQQPLSDNATVVVIWPPPQPPMFHFTSNTSLGGSVSVEEGKNVTVSCTVNGGKPEIKSVNIDCHDAKKNRVSFGINRTVPTRTPFIVQGSPSLHRTRCICSADHESGCYNSVALVYFTVPSQVVPRENRDLYEPPSEAIAFYVSAGVIGCIVLIFVGGITVYLRGRWSDLYYYIYTFASTVANRSHRNDGENLALQAIAISQLMDDTDSDSRFNNETSRQSEPLLSPQNDREMGNNRNTNPFRRTGDADKGPNLQAVSPSVPQPVPRIFDKPPPLPKRKRSRSTSNLMSITGRCRHDRTRARNFNEEIDDNYSFPSRPPPPLPPRSNWKSVENFSFGVAKDDVQNKRQSPVCTCCDQPPPLPRKPRWRSEENIYSSYRTINNSGINAHDHSMSSRQNPPPLPRKPESPNNFMPQAAQISNNDRPPLIGRSDLPDLLGDAIISSPPPLPVRRNITNDHTDGQHDPHKEPSGLTIGNDDAPPLPPKPTWRQGSDPAFDRHMSTRMDSLGLHVDPLSWSGSDVDLSCRSGSSFNDDDYTVGGSEVNGRFSNNVSALGTENRQVPSNLTHHGWIADGLGQDTSRDHSLPNEIAPPPPLPPPPPRPRERAVNSASPDFPYSQRDNLIEERDSVPDRRPPPKPCNMNRKLFV